MSTAAESQMTDVVPDEILLVRIAQKDASAMSLLYDRHAALLYGLLAKIAPTLEEANDLLQDVFMLVWTRAPAYQPTRGKVLPWLCSIARNRGIDAQRRRSTRASKKDAIIMQEVQRRPHTRREEDPWEKLMMIEDASTAREALASLSDVQREIITTAFFRGLTQQEISTSLGIPLGTVKSRMRQGLQQMATYLTEEKEKEK